jgi:hypothetical protein
LVEVISTENTVSKHKSEGGGENAEKMRPARRRDGETGIFDLVARWLH